MSPISQQALPPIPKHTGTLPAGSQVELSGRPQEGNSRSKGKIGTGVAMEMRISTITIVFFSKLPSLQS